jgi:nucleotide-binding universal stress UspA family protein
MTGRVIVGSDGSESSRRAIRWAAEEARCRGAVLEVVHAWTLLGQPDDGTFDPNYGEAEARQLLDGELAGLGDALDGIEVERTVVCDLGAPALLDAGKRADLLVVGSRGRGGFRGLLLGSVSSQVVQHAPCPVAVIPDESRQPR